MVGGVIVTPDEKSLFLDAVGDVRPLKSGTDVHWEKSQPPRPRRHRDDLQLDNFLTTGFLEIVPLSEPLLFRRDGLQTGVLDKLRKGKYGREASLNLRQQSVEQCRTLLYAFILQATRDGLRNLLVVHGRARSDNTHANVVRSYLARWLPEFDEVQAFAEAQPQHGGSGACYVSLRKSALAKLDNRERHAARRG
jgi:DNA-nicking Smr family endonuclease